ncbi:hypothetical protein GO308_09690 [Sphingomonas sp. SFZ2018-12]|uniref:hypothetical protein n=1 Tax=Sphingomonas sp. SFZ2018-12 TaxID=2683197 RepID=UPI001F0E00EB|nr:hypothetical protein [Sphingomonas sp. SFZ2018-12]MCH4893380.1 hypothetical protein [Sphingomonas sp. SFZ2018-12]
MSKRNNRAADVVSTKPRPRDAQGRELDEYGLPLIGPARQRALAELGKPDPNTDPKAWRETGRDVVTDTPAAIEQETPSDG